jgi:hypothetical protein
MVRWQSAVSRQGPKVIPRGAFRIEKLIADSE